MVRSESGCWFEGEGVPQHTQGVLSLTKENLCKGTKKTPCVCQSIQLTGPNGHARTANLSSLP